MSDSGEGGAPEIRRRSSFRSDVAQAAATNLAIAAVNVVTGLIAARILGPDGRGELAAIFSWPLLLAALATLGLPDAIVYFCARSPRRAGTHFATALVPALAASAVFAGIGWVAMPWLLAAQDTEVVTAARWYLLSVPLAATLGMADRPLRGIGDFRSWNLLRVAPTIAWLAILLVALVHGSSTPVILAVAFLVARLLLVAPMLRFVRNRVDGAWRYQGDLVRPMLRFGLPSFVTVLPTILNQRLDQLIMAAFLPASTLGVYVVAVAWSGMLAPLMLAFGNALFPRIAGTGQSDEQRGEVFARGLRIGVAMAIVLGLGAAAVTPLLLPVVFGSAFREAVPPALVLIAAAGVAGVNIIGQEGLRGLGRPGLVLRSEALGLVVTLAALAVLLPSFAIMGAALASLVGYLTVAALVAVGGRGVTSLPIRHLLVPTRADLVGLLGRLRRSRR